MTEKLPKSRRRLSCPAWLWRVLLVSWDVPATRVAPRACSTHGVPLTFAGLRRRHLTRQWRRHRRKETR
jgi:hypothetical protein